MTLFLLWACLQLQRGQGSSLGARTNFVRGLVNVSRSHDRTILWAGPRAGRPASGRHLAGQHDRKLSRPPRSSSTSGVA